MNNEQMVLYRKFIRREIHNLVRDPLGNEVEFVLMDDNDRILLFKAWAEEQHTINSSQIDQIPLDTQRLQDEKALLESIRGLS